MKLTLYTLRHCIRPKHLESWNPKSISVEEALRGLAPGKERDEAIKTNKDGEIYGLWCWLAPSWLAPSSIRDRSSLISAELHKEIDGLKVARKENEDYLLDAAIEIHGLNAVIDEKGRQIEDLSNQVEEFRRAFKLMADSLKIDESLLGNSMVYNEDQEWYRMMLTLRDEQTKKEDVMTPTMKIMEDGTQEWRLNGRHHREDGPAIIWPDGREDSLHREDGPAVTDPDGYQAWYLNGKSSSRGEVWGENN